MHPIAPARRVADATPTLPPRGLPARHVAAPHEPARPVATPPVAAPPASLVEVLRRLARERPDDVALELLDADGGRSRVTTYAALDRRARHAASLLQRLGATGAPVLLLFPVGLEGVAALLGCLYAGAAAMPARLPHDGRAAGHVRRLVADAGVRCVLTTGALRSALDAQLAGGGVAVAAPFDPGDAADDRADEWTPTAPAPDAPALLSSTSGTTGAPRCVVATHANLAHALALVSRTFGIGPADRTLSALPASHGMGLLGGVLQPLYSGCRGLLMAPAAVLRRPLRWLEAISRHGATISGGPGSMYDLCVRTVSPAQRARLDLSRWQLAIVGSDPVRPRTLWRFSHAFAASGFRPTAFAPCYGLAEATLAVALRRRGEAPVVRAFDADALAAGRWRPTAVGLGRLVTGCGRPDRDLDVRVVDPATGAPCAADAVGEIWIAGPGVARGYWRRPAATARAFGARVAGTAEGPFLRTGDLGFVAEGELFVVGRVGDAMAIRGRRHHPHEVEEIVDAAHRALRPDGGAAFPVATDGEESLVVVHEVERDALRALDADAVALAVRVALARRLGLHARDVVLVRPGALPRTPGGRVDRRACRARYRDGALDAIAPRRATRPAPGEARVTSR